MSEALDLRNATNDAYSVPLDKIDISNPDQVKETSRLTLIPAFDAHWTGWDAKTKRLVVTGSHNRIFLVKLNDKGVLSVDEAFKDENGKPGFDMANKTWPHGWTGTGQPHGVVFSRQ